MASIMKAIFLSYMCFWILGTGNASCPSNCTCSSDYSVHCCLSQLSNRLDIPQGVLGPQWKSIQIEGLQLGDLDSSTFRGRIDTAESLDMQNNAISTIDVDTFEGLNKLETIDLSFNFLKELPKYLFRTNNGLKKLIVRGNHLCEISDNIMPQYQQLKHLDVSGNQIITWNMDICDNFDDKFEIRAFGNQFEDLELDIFCPVKDPYIDKVTKILDFNGNGLANLTLKRECPDGTYDNKNGNLIHVDIDLRLEDSKLKSLEAVSFTKISTCPIWNSTHGVKGIMRVSTVKGCFCSGTLLDSFGDFSFSVRTDSHADKTALCGRNTEACKREERQCKDGFRARDLPFLNSDSNSPTCIPPETSKQPPVPVNLMMWIAIGAGGFSIVLVTVIIIVSCCCCQCCHGCRARYRKPSRSLDEDYNSSVATTSTDVSMDMMIIPEIRQKKKKPKKRKKARMPSPPFSRPQRKPALSPKAIETYDLPPPPIAVPAPALPAKTKKEERENIYQVPPTPQPVAKTSKKSQPPRMPDRIRPSPLKPRLLSPSSSPTPRPPFPLHGLLPDPALRLRSPPLSDLASRPVPPLPPVPGSPGVHPQDVYTELSNQSERGYIAMSSSSGDQHGRIYNSGYFGDDSFHEGSDSDNNDYDNAPTETDVYEDALPKRPS